MKKEFKKIEMELITTDNANNGKDNCYICGGEIFFGENKLVKKFSEEKLTSHYYCFLDAFKSLTGYNIIDWKRNLPLYETFSKEEALIFEIDSRINAIETDILNGNENLIIRYETLLEAKELINKTFNPGSGT